MRALAVLLVVIPAASSGGVSEGMTFRLGEIVRPIKTTIYYADGALQHNRGNGFVVGNLFYTAYHNLRGRGTGPRITARDTELGGISVKPMAIDVEHDLAVFEIPATLCPKWCNDIQLAETGMEAESVTWLRPDGDNQLWRQGSVSNLAYTSTSNEAAAFECDANLVVEVDVPFYPGSSGGPVFDAASGAIVGLIQGSFERAGGVSTGYYKPVRCMLARLDPGSNRS